MDPYHSIPRISNSDLTRFKNQLFGKDEKRPEKAFAFGTAFHELVLEPKAIHSLPKEMDVALLQRLVSQVRQNAFCQWYLQFSQKENIVLFDDPDTGLGCKSKLDVVYKNRTIIDFKTTSARDYTSFLATCTAYDYDRQAAFYLDSIGGKRFVFVGVQKCKPFQLFFFEATTKPAFIQLGQKKYKALLRKWKETNGLP